jgi:hypothetical protein
MYQIVLLCPLVGAGNDDDEGSSTSGVQTTTDSHHGFLQSANYSADTRSDNLIPGMATVCCWGVESGKLM